MISGAFGTFLAERYIEKALSHFKDLGGFRTRFRQDLDGDAVASVRGLNDAMVRNRKSRTLIFIFKKGCDDPAGAGQS